MAKGRLCVRRLTLTPNSNLGAGREDEDSKDEDNQALLHLDRERLS
jgi:hypothetical protein